MHWRPYKLLPLLCFVATIAHSARVEATTAKRKTELSGEAALQDFRVMQTILAQAHATAFAQIPKAPLPDLFAREKQVAIRDFISRVLRYYRGIQVDHTGLGFSPELIESLELKTAFFPFPLKFFRGRAYFDCAYREIPFGAELVAINNRPLPAILKRFAEITSIENDRGDSDDYRLSESFSLLYYIAEGPASRWELRLNAQNQTTEVIIDTTSSGSAAFVPRKSTELPYRTKPIYVMFNPQIRAAYLAINTFMPAGKDLDSIENWSEALFNFHREAARQNAENLVIDLRANRGGVMLFSAAAAAWFVEKRVEDKSRSRARVRMLPYREAVHAINSIAANETMLRETEQHLQSDFADKMLEGYFETRNLAARYLTLSPIPQAHRFRKIYILLSRATYSAAVNFARLVKIGNAKVVLVGEETGSPGDGHSAEIIVTYRLPNTGLLFEIPLVQVEFNPTAPGQEKGRGLKPDIISEDTVADFLSGRDVQLDLVSELMAQQQSNAEK